MPRNSKYLAGLEVKPCPFCSQVAPITTQDVREAYEDDAVPDAANFISVVCDFNNGGCGGHSCFQPTLQEAVESWNRRDERKVVPLELLDRYPPHQYECPDCGCGTHWCYNYCIRCGAKLDWRSHGWVMVRRAEEGVE